jgi:ribonuclease HI
VYTAAVAVRSGVRGQRVGYGLYYGPGHCLNAGYAVTGARATLQRGYLHAALRALAEADAGVDAGAALRSGDVGAASGSDNAPPGESAGGGVVLRHPSRVHVVTPSLYAANCVRQYASEHARRGWRARDGAPVKNEDLLRALHASLQRVRATADHVPDEVGSRGVAIATELARAAINSPLVSRVVVPSAEIWDGNK